MYRPDRIGPWSIGNLDKAFIADAKADFDTHDSAFTTYSAYSLNATSGENFLGETFNFSGSPSLANAMQVGLGVQVSGVGYDKNYMYSISGTLMYDDSTEIMVEVVLGRLAAAPSAAGPIVIANPIIIPITSAKNAAWSQFAVNHTVVSTLLDGGSAPSTEFDICAFWRLTNVSGAGSAIGGMSGRIALHRYGADLETLDPNR